MSKATKALAVLGVVAGLGVSMLPLSAYAVDDTYDVDNKAANQSSVHYATGDNAIDPGVSGNVIVKATVEGFISLTISGNAAVEGTHSHVVDLGTLTFGAMSEAGATLNVKTNNANGYSVKIIDADTSNALVLQSDEGDDVVDPTANQKIPANASVADGTPGWGYKTSLPADNDNVTGLQATYAAVPVSTGTAATIATGTSVSADTGDNITLTFGASSSATNQAGEYRDTVVITALAKAGS